MKFPSNRKLIAKTLVFTVLASISVFVLLPTFYLISFTLTRWNEVYIDVFANPLIGDTNWQQILRYLGFSFRLSFLAVILDFLFGIPLAYFLARKQFFRKSLFGGYNHPVIGYSNIRFWRSNSVDVDGDFWLRRFSR